MTAPRPGWYPDPSDPRRLRWWSGVAWTDATTPWPTAAPGETSQPAAWRAPPTAPPARFPVGRVVLIAAGVCTVAVLAAVAAGNAGSDLTCERLAYEAVAYGQESAEVPLLSVTDVEVVEDHQRELVPLTEQVEGLLLACEGMGTWDDGVLRPVRLELTVDADGQQWVTTEPQ